ncbi:hypothetical protein [Kitasatospora sp. NPDC087315]|uniref:hypothetical protein n=1 Tax=Kitasatospora sp. NPDC087315 TaxID=3364069 RepID=UPI00381059E3
MPEQSAPPAPTPEQLRTWLTELHPKANWVVEVLPDGNLRAHVPPYYPNLPLGYSEKMTMSDGRAQMQRPNCPWLLAVDRVDVAGDRVDSGGVALVVRPITPAEAEVRTAEAAAKAEQRQRAAAEHQQQIEAQAAARRARAEEARERQRQVQEAWRAAHATAHPLRSVPPADLPPVAHSHDEDFYHGFVEPERFRRIGPEPELRMARPLAGTGLWTSPVTAGAGEAIERTAWSDWWDEQGGDPSTYTEHLLIAPDADARILLVDGMDDLLALVQAYPNPATEDSDPDDHRFANWAALAADWDAVYLTTAGAAALGQAPEDDTPEDDAPHLHGWGCTSVFWLRPAYSVPHGLGL